MPWAVVLRAIARLAAGLFLWRAATARRGAYRTAGGPPLQHAAPPPRLRNRDALRRVRETVSLGWRAIAATVFIAASALLLTGGVTLTVLSPRWLGIVLLILASVAIAAAVGEIVAACRTLETRRRRRHDEELRRQIS